MEGMAGSGESVSGFSNLAIGGIGAENHAGSVLEFFLSMSTGSGVRRQVWGGARKNGLQKTKF